MIKLVSFVVAIGIVALAVYLVRRRDTKDEKLTDKRARADALKQLLALSEQDVRPAAENKTSKEEASTPKSARTPPPSVPAMTRQQRRAEQRRKDKIALAKSQHA